MSEHVERASSLLYSRYGPKAAEHAAHAMLLDTHLKEDVNVGHLHSKRGDVGGSQFLANNRTNTVKLFGTRVVPVYLLSLASYGKSVTLDEDDGLDGVRTMISRMTMTTITYETTSLPMKAWWLFYKTPRRLLRKMQQLSLIHI